MERKQASSAQVIHLRRRLAALQQQYKALSTALHNARVKHISQPSPHKPTNKKAKNPRCCSQCIDHGVTTNQAKQAVDGSADGGSPSKQQTPAALHTTHCQCAHTAIKEQPVQHPIANTAVAIAQRLAVLESQMEHQVRCMEQLLIIMRTPPSSATASPCKSCIPPTVVHILHDTMNPNAHPLAHPMQAPPCSTPPPCTTSSPTVGTIQTSHSKNTSPQHNHARLLQHLEHVLQVTADEAHHDMWYLQHEMHSLRKSMLHGEHTAAQENPSSYDQHSCTSSMRTSVLVQGVDTLLDTMA